MKKLWGALALGLVAVLVLLLLKKGDDRGMSARELKLMDLPLEDQGDYRALLNVRQRVFAEDKKPLDKILLRSEGILSQYPNAAKDTVTEWKSISQLTILDKVVDPSYYAPLIGKKSVTQISGGEAQHFLGDDFPKEFMRSQIALLSRLFVAVPLNGKEKLQRKEVEDSTPFTAEYSFEKDGEITIVDKVWLTIEQKGITVDSKMNSIRYFFSSSGRLLAAKGALNLKYSKPNISEVLVELDVRLDSSAKASPENISISKDSMKVFDSNRMEASDNQIQANQELPFEEAMQKLSEMSDKTDSAQVYRIFSALKSHVRATPAYADRLVKRILASKERDPSTRRQMSAMFGALAQSKNPAIADTLSQLASECPDNYCKVQAIVGLNDHVKPTEASAAKMIDLAASTPDQEVAATALLAAGSIGHKIDAQLPELPKTLIKIYGEPGKEGIKTSVLAAMGNHGNSEYLPVLEAGLKDKEAVMRAASVYSLRNIPSPSVNESIVNVIEKDESKSVVREALKAVAYRTMTADEYMKIAVKSASFDNQELQEDAARVMVDAYKANPGPLEAAIRTFHDKASFPNVKVYIETQSKPLEAAAP